MRYALVATAALLFALAPMPALADHFVVHNSTGVTAWVTFYDCGGIGGCVIKRTATVPSRKDGDKIGTRFEYNMVAGTPFHLRIEISALRVDQTIEGRSTSDAMVWNACLPSTHFAWCVVH